MEKKSLKGFTLVELIIVMAIFSLLMVGAMSLIDPVSKIYKHSNDFERTYSYVDNIQNYLQGSLQYADNLWVYQGVDTVDFNIETEVFEYKEAFYKDIISTSNGSTINYSKCKIRVMTILNSDLPYDVDGNGSIGTGEGYPKGQILMRDVTLTSDAAVLPALSAYTPQLNDTFFGGKYSFDYTLGASSFVNMGDSSMVNNLAPINVEGVATSLDISDFAIGIVTYDTGVNKDGTSKATDVTEVMPVSGKSYVYRTYDPASQYSIANIPLMNLISRKGNVNPEYLVYGRNPADNSYDTSVIKNYPGEYYPQAVGDAHPYAGHQTFEHDAANISMSANDNIYIIYSLPDEVNIPQ